MIFILLLLFLLFALRRAPANFISYTSLQRQLRPGQFYLWPLERILCKTQPSNWTWTTVDLQFRYEIFRVDMGIRVLEFSLGEWYAAESAPLIDYPPKFEWEKVLETINTVTAKLDPSAPNLYETLNKLYAKPTKFSPSLTALVKFEDISAQPL